MEKVIWLDIVTDLATKTNLNGYSGTETVEEGAREAVRSALLGPDGRLRVLVGVRNQEPSETVRS
jgi:hypothetical protein